MDQGTGSKTVRNRALILLKADEGEHEPGVGARTAERTRRQLVGEGFEAVLPRELSPNRQYRKPDGAQEAALVTLVCSKTRPGGHGGKRSRK